MTPLPFTITLQKIHIFVKFFTFTETMCYSKCYNFVMGGSNKLHFDIDNTSLGGFSNLNFNCTWHLWPLQCHCKNSHIFVKFFTLQKNMCYSKCYILSWVVQISCSLISNNSNLGVSHLNLHRIFPLWPLQ